MFSKVGEEEIFYNFCKTFKTHLCLFFINSQTETSANVFLKEHLVPDYHSNPLYQRPPMDKPPNLLPSYLKTHE